MCSDVANQGPRGTTTEAKQAEHLVPLTIMPIPSPPLPQGGAPPGVLSSAPPFLAGRRRNPGQAEWPQGLLDSRQEQPPAGRTPETRQPPGPREAGVPGFESLIGAGSFDLTLPLDHSAPVPTVKRERDPQTDCSL